MANELNVQRPDKAKVGLNRAEVAAIPLDQISTLEPTKFTGYRQAGYQAASSASPAEVTKPGAKQATADQANPDKTAKSDQPQQTPAGRRDDPSATATAAERSVAQHESPAASATPSAQGQAPAAMLAAATVEGRRDAAQQILSSSSSSGPIASSDPVRRMRVEGSTAFRIPTKAELDREQLLAEEASRAKKRDVFGAAGFVYGDIGDFAAVDDDAVNHATATTDWGGYDEYEQSPAEQVFDAYFNAAYDLYTVDTWSDQDWGYSNPHANYYETGTYDLEDPETQYTLMNSKLVTDDDGNPSYIDVPAPGGEGGECVNPNSERGKAILAGKQALDAQDIANEAAGTPLDISDAEIKAKVESAAYNDDGTLTYDGQTLDPDSIEGQRVIQARGYLDAYQVADTRAENLKTAAASPLDITDPAVAARVNEAEIKDGYIDVDGMCVKPDSVEGLQLAQAKGALTETPADVAAGTTPAADTAANPQGADVAAAYTATVDQQTAAPAADTALDAKFEELKEKFELTPEQLELKKPEQAPPPVPAPTAAPQFEPAT